MDREAGALEHALEQRERAAFGRRHRGAAQQVAGEGDGIGGRVGLIGGALPAGARVVNQMNRRPCAASRIVPAVRRPSLRRWEQPPRATRGCVIFCQILLLRLVVSSSMSLTVSMHHRVGQILRVERGELAGQRQHLAAIIEIAHELESAHGARLGDDAVGVMRVQQGARVLGQLVHVDDVGDRAEDVQVAQRPAPLDAGLERRSGRTAPRRSAP